MVHDIRCDMNHILCRPLQLFIISQAVTECNLFEYWQSYGHLKNALCLSTISLSQ